jgi:hypothetical protein
MSEMKNAGPYWVRHNHKWTSKEIDALIDFGVLQFLPVSYTRKPTSLAPDKQKRLKSGLAKKLGGEICKKLDAIVVELEGLNITEEELEGKIGRHLLRIFHPDAPAMFTAPEDDSKLPEVLRQLEPLPPLDLIVLSNATHYLRVSLGRSPRSGGLRFTAASVRDRRQLRKDQLTKASQSGRVREWTGLYDDIWNDPSWRECMWFRYEKNNPPAIDLLPTKWRTRLDREAARLRRDPGATTVTSEQVQQAADGTDPSTWIGLAIGVLRFDYLRAKIAGDLKSDHPLRKSVHESGLFTRIAILRAQYSQDPGARSNYVERFCQYLSIPPGHPNELVGRLIMRLLKIEADYWQKEDEPAVASERSRLPRKLRPDEFATSHDFRTVADRIAAALGIDRGLISQLWGNWCGLKIGHFWQKRAASKHTAYWMAYILETEHNDVFRVYAKWVESFLVTFLRPLLGLGSASQVGVRRAALGPFLDALLHDPLLCAVLHYEVLGGKEDVKPLPSTPKREDNLPLKLIVAHAHEVLTKAHPSTPTESIETILTDDDFVDHTTRVALHKTNRHPRMGGFCHEAYVAVLVTAMIGDGKTAIYRDQVYDIYRRIKNRALLAELEAEPDRFIARIVRGETLR